MDDRSGVGTWRCVENSLGQKHPECEVQQDCGAAGDECCKDGTGPDDVDVDVEVIGDAPHTPPSMRCDVERVKGRGALLSKVMMNPCSLPCVRMW